MEFEIVNYGFIVISSIVAIVLGIIYYRFIIISSLVGVIPVIVGTIKRKGKWGINVKPVFCPNCGKQAPRIRKATSMEETLWGGWTCTNCGCKMDKWGEKRT